MSNQLKESQKSKLMTKNNVHSLIFTMCWIFIGGVGAIDTFLTIKLSEGLIHNEQNPIARFILQSDNWDVSKFIGLKMFGTILVLGIVVCIFKRHSNYGLMIVSGIATFQALLLLYLLW